MFYKSFPSEALPVVEAAIRQALRDYHAGKYSGDASWGLDTWRTGEAIVIVAHPQDGARDVVQAVLAPPTRCDKPGCGVTHTHHGGLRALFNDDPPAPPVVREEAS
jgi:hypothetical protein